MKLNLTANGEAEKRIKEYLENNASEVLAEKINNGVLIEKDGKTLINKKTLSGFMKYATNEARKQVAQGAQSAYVEDSVVYGWAVHYFEEDSIEEKLYTEDGEEYTKTPKKKENKKEKNRVEERTLFDDNDEIDQYHPNVPPIPNDEIEREKERLRKQGVIDTDDDNDGGQAPTSVVQPKKKSQKGISENQISLFDLLG